MKKVKPVKAWAIAFEDRTPDPYFSDVRIKGYPYLLFDKRVRARTFMLNEGPVWNRAWKIVPVLITPAHKPRAKGKRK